MVTKIHLSNHCIEIVPLGFGPGAIIFAIIAPGPNYFAIFILLNKIKIVGNILEC